MKRVWKKYDDVIPGVLKGIGNDCFAWKLFVRRGVIRSWWSLAANFCRVAWVTCSLKVRMPKEIFHGSSILNSMRLNCGR